MEQIWANIAENWEVLMYLSGLIVSFVFGRKKSLTKEDKLKIELAKKHKKTMKAENAYKKAFKNEEETKEKMNNDNSSVYR